MKRFQNGMVKFKICSFLFVFLFKLLVNFHCSVILNTKNHDKISESKMNLDKEKITEGSAKEGDTTRNKP